MSKTELVVKDNALIDASYSLDVIEQRLILLAIIEAREIGSEITAGEFLEIHASCYMNQFKVEKHAAYEALSNACKSLFRRYFTYQDTEPKTGKSRLVESRWVSKVAYIQDAAVVQICFAPDVIPLITRLESNFTSYEIQQISSLSSAYAIRLYELLIKWRSLGKTQLFALGKLRDQLGVGVNEYKTMSNFKKWVLDFAIQQINKHTDITVTYEQHKAGRVITGFTFMFTQKKQPKDVIPKPKKPEPKSKTIKKEEQLDWMTSDILDRFISLSPSQQQAILDRIEPTLKGATQARFKVARAGSIKQLVTEFSLDINDALMRSAKG